MHYYCSHFINGETEAQSVRWLPKCNRDLNELHVLKYCAVSLRDFIFIVFRSQILPSKSQDSVWWALELWKAGVRSAAECYNWRLVQFFCIPIFFSSQFVLTSMVAAGCYEEMPRSQNSKRKKVFLFALYDLPECTVRRKMEKRKLTRPMERW